MGAEEFERLNPHSRSVFLANVLEAAFTTGLDNILAWLDAYIHPDHDAGCTEQHNSRIEMFRVSVLIKLF